MTSTLVLVRHAMAVLDPRTPAESWKLGAEGREASRLLASVLPQNPLLLTSTEPKARQTAQEILSVRGGTIRSDERVVEVGRPPSWFANHEQLARDYVAGTQHPGWEAHADVVVRFDTAVRAAAECAGDQPVVVVSHGQAMTVWLRSRALVQDPDRFWRELRFPDAWQLTVPPITAPGPPRLLRLAPALESWRSGSTG